MTSKLQGLRSRFPQTVAIVVLLSLVTLPAAWHALAQQPAPVFQSYPVKHRLANDLAPSLRKLLDSPNSGVKVLVDQEQNQLVVQGPPASQQIAAQTLRALDQPPRRPAETPRPSGRIVQTYRVNAADLNQLAGQLRGQHSAAKIEVDVRTGQLIVVADEAAHQQIARQLGVERPAPAPRPAERTTPAPPAFTPVPTPAAPPAAPTTHQLTYVNATQFEQALRRIWGTRLDLSTARDGGSSLVSTPTADGRSAPALQINRQTGQVRFIGSADRQQAWRVIAQAIDRPTGRDDNQTDIVPVEKVDPRRVETAVAFMQPPVDGAPDAAAQPGAAPQGAPGASGLATAVVADDEGGGLIGQVQIEYIEGADAFIIRGHARDVARIRKLIEEIEQKIAETQPVVEVYHLRNINSEAATDLITEVYEEILSPRQGQVSIRALVDPNAILLVGREESVQVVMELIGKLDRPMLEEGGFRVFQLKHVSALDAGDTVNNFFVNQPGTDTEQRGGLGTRLRVIADYRTNSLIVQASPRDLNEIDRLLKTIDVEDSPATAEVKVFRLKNALAENLAAVLQAAISGQAQAGTGQQQPFQPFPGQQQQQQGGGNEGSRLPSTALEFKVVDQERREVLLRSGVLADVQVTFDPNINALLVKAPAKSMTLIEALINELDQLPDAEAQIKVFTMVNADATNLAQMLQQLFGQEVTAGVGTSQFPFGLNQFGQNQLQAATGGEGSLVPLRFAVDVRTNSIIASGSTDDLIIVETILLRLDESDIEPRRLTVVRLKNAPALDVANSITTFLQSQQQLFQQLLFSNQAISPYEQIEREVIVVPEVVTNSLIVSATPQYYDEIMRVITDLDFRPPMVMVQVLIAEVTLSDDYEFGIETGIQDSLLFDRGAVTPAPANVNNPGFNFITTTTNAGNPALPNLSSVGRSTVAPQGISQFGLGRASTIPGIGYGGLVLSAASDSVNALLRAMEQEGKLQILSRPQIMTLNNQEAFVQVGADVSRITGTTITQGIVQNNVIDVQTGLILRVTPLINDDGIIVMDIDAERSALGSANDGTVVGTDQNGNPIISPPINRTTAQSTISAKSGQTVVFAGLITDSTDTQIRTVPYLKDIPVVGELFKFEIDRDRRTELLIVMTPYIISDDEDYEFIKMIESQRMSWCLGDVVSIHGEVGLQGGACVFCDDNVPMLFPDLDPSWTPSKGHSHHGHAHDTPYDSRGGDWIAPEGVAPEVAPLPEPVTQRQPAPANPMNGAAPASYGAPPRYPVQPARFEPLPPPTPTYNNSLYRR